MNKDFKQSITIQNPNIDKCPDQDVQDISSLIIATYALIELYKEKKISSYVYEGIMHLFGLMNGVAAINMTVQNRNIFAFLFIPMMLLFANNGFTASTTSHQAKQDQKNATEQFNNLQEIIKTSSPEHLHQIAQIFRQESPKVLEQDITPEDINRILRHIMLKYQR